MNTKQLRALMEAYQQVYAPQEVEQLDEITASMGRRAKKYREDKEQAAHMERMRQHQEKMKNDPEYKKSHEDSLKTHAREEFDIFDTVLEFLQVEGYAETLEEAEWMMANELDAEDINAILGEADSLAAFQARREKRRAAMKKKTGYEGHDYTKPYTGPTGGDKPEQRRG